MESRQAEGLRIEFLYDPDCPSHVEALARLRDILEEQDPTAEIVVEAILSQEQVQQRRFIGSPTIRVNGADIDPASEHRQDYALSCRAYVKPDGRITPLPPRELIREALVRARTSART